MTTKIDIINRIRTMQLHKSGEDCPGELLRREIVKVEDWSHDLFLYECYGATYETERSCPVDSLKYLLRKFNYD